MKLYIVALQNYKEYYDINIQDILIIQDDLDLPVGTIRLKENSGDGGHNGIKSIIKCLKSKEFKRLKIGISNNKVQDTKDYVLGKFTKSEINTLNEILHVCGNIIDDFSKLSFIELMSKYNNRG